MNAGTVNMVRFKVVLQCHRQVNESRAVVSCRLFHKFCSSTSAILYGFACGLFLPFLFDLKNLF